MTIPDVTAGNQITAAEQNTMIEVVNRNAKIVKNGGVAHQDILDINNRPFYTDDADKTSDLGTISILRIFRSGDDYETRTVTSDWASASHIEGVVILGAYVYILLRNGGGTERRVYRYDVTDLSSGGTQMTAAFFDSTSTTGARMTSDGTDLFISHDAGRDASNDYEIARITISGTTLSVAETIVCGSTAGYFDSFAVTSDSIYAWDSAAGNILRKYNRSGTLQATSSLGVGDGVVNSEGVPLIYYEDGLLTCFSRVQV